MATHSSILAWRILWTEEPGELQSMGVTKNWTRLSTHAHRYEFGETPLRQKSGRSHWKIIVWSLLLCPEVCHIQSLLPLP